MRSVLVALITCLFSFAPLAKSALAQSAVFPEEYGQLLQRLDAAEERIRQLEAEHDPAAASELHAGAASPFGNRMASFLTSDLAQPKAAGGSSAQGSQFETGYSNGFFIRPKKGESNPNNLKVNGRMQFQYVGMNSQNPALPNQSLLKLNRGRLIFSGNYFTPKLSFYLQTAFETGIASSMIIKDFYVSYEFNKAFRANFGQWKAAASRSWLESSQRLEFTDRSMATTFFRPNRTQGIWFDGNPTDRTHYIVMIGNGYKTYKLTPAQMDDNFGYFATAYWDPVGEYGNGYPDLEFHENLAVRMGGSFGYSKMGPTNGSNEINFFVLNDTGQTITSVYPGANGAAAGFNAALYACDFEAKYRGFSYSSEVYFRNLGGFKGSAVPVSQIFDWGYYQTAGYFLIPKKFELMARQSRVIGSGGSPSADQLSLGFNWFFDGHPRKFTFEATHLNGCPVTSDHPNLRAGDNGMLYISQLEASF